MSWVGWIPWIVAGGLLAVFFVLGLGGWPGEFTGAGGMFCEHFRDGWVKQPANTWSNLGFVAAGLWIATRVNGGGVRVPGAGRNLFTRSRTMPVVYAALVVFLGPGSMFMHGSGRDWGATVDVVSMLVWIAFPVAYAGVRCLGGGERAFWAAYLVLALGLGGLRALEALPLSGSVTYALLIPAFVGLEIGAARRPGVERQPRWLGLAALAFFTALAVWRLSHTGAPLCDPHSLLQGHAAWHLLCALATVGIFLFYATEDEGRKHREDERPATIQRGREA